jgi:hypothetical protein
MAVATKVQLEAQLTQLALQRSSLKDQIELIEKQMAVTNGVVTYLQAQEAEREALLKAAVEAESAKASVTKD